MVESSPPNLNSLQPPPPPPPTPAPAPAPAAVAVKNPRPSFYIPPCPPIRVTSQFESETSVFFHKVSCKLFDSLAKLKLSFKNNSNGDVSDPQLDLITKYLSLHYDVEKHNASAKGSFDVGDKFKFRAAKDGKAQRGEVAMVANLFDPSYKLELSSKVPYVGLPKATFKFPLGEVSLEEKEEDVKRVFSISGTVKGQLLNAVCTAKYKDKDLNLSYCYKDEEISFIPSMSLPSNALSFAFKRRFGPSDKLSYWYKFGSNYWGTEYKHIVSKDVKFKAGYDSEVRLGRATLWVGKEKDKTKKAPMKTKVKFMLKVPQDDIKKSDFTFWVKKRWDF